MKRLHKFLIGTATLVVALALFVAPAYADLTISSATQFSTLDGGVNDADGSANGCFTYSGGNLIVSATGSILNNDPVSPANNSAGNICASVTAGDILLQGAIKAENLTSGGSGGNIQLTASGDVTLQSTATISSSRVASGGSGIAGNITITGTSASSEVTIDSGAAVKAESANGNGGNITITAPDGITVNGTVSASASGSSASNGGTVSLTSSGPTGDISIGTGGVVKADATSNVAGDLTLTAARYITIDGTVSSTALNGQGGAIWVASGCTLTVGDNGVVTSQGKDAGADLVHLQGCDVNIYGLVQSTGIGHAASGSRLCYDADGSGPNAPTRPDKSSASTACVEIWAGGDLVIDSTGTHNGQVNADTSIASGGANGRGWIDLIARGDVTIIGDSTGAFAVHADQPVGGTGTGGGAIKVQSLTGDVTASGLALQADAINGAGKGGSIVIQGEDDVTLNNAKLSAQGDSVESGGYGFGGQINVRAFNGLLTWQNGTGDVRPTGTDNVGTTLPAANRGTISLQDCVAGVVNTTGTTFPNNGSPATTPTELADSCGVNVTLASYVVLPPVCDSCSATPTPTPSATPTPTPSPSESPSPSPTPTPTPSEEPSPTPRPTPTPSEEPSPSPTPTPEETPSPTPTPTPEVETTPEETPSPTPTPEPSPSPTPDCDTPTTNLIDLFCPSPTPTATPTPEESPSPTPSEEPSPSPTPTPEVQTTPEESPSASPSEEPSPTPESSPSEEPSPSPSAGVQASPDPTPSIPVETEGTPDPGQSPQTQASADPSATPGASTVNDPGSSSGSSAGGIAPTSFADTGGFQAALPGLVLLTLGGFSIRRWRRLRR